MTPQTKKCLLIIGGLVMFASGCILLTIGNIRFPQQAPGGASITAVLCLSQYGLALAIIGFLLGVWGVLHKNVPKWIA